MEGWKTVPLAKCLQRIGTPKKIPRKQFEDTGRFPIVSQEREFINGYWSDEAAVIHVQSPLVVFGDHTQVLKYIDFNFVVGADGVKLLQPEPFLDPKYLYYFLMGHPVRSLGYARHFKLLKKLEIVFPELLREQERIVAILDEAFASIATATANAEKNLANARELFESIRHDSIARATEEWDRRPLGEICENLDRLRVPITKSKRVAGSVPYYGASGVVDHVAEHLFDEDLLLVSEDGANLLARTYPIAFSIIGKSWVNNHAHVLRFTTNAQREFVERYLNSIPLDEWVSGMAQPKLNQRSLNSIPIPWTEDDVPMRSLTNGLREAKSRTEILAEFCERRLINLTDLKQSLLHKAFTGELTADTKAADRSLSEAGV